MVNPPTYVNDIRSPGEYKNDPSNHSLVLNLPPLTVLTHFKPPQPLQTPLHRPCQFVSTYPPSSARPSTGRHRSHLGSGMPCGRTLGPISSSLLQTRRFRMSVRAVSLRVTSAGSSAIRRHRGYQTSSSPLPTGPSGDTPSSSGPLAPRRSSPSLFSSVVCHSWLGSCSRTSTSAAFSLSSHSMQ